jgi:hypothetical protein
MNRISYRMYWECITSHYLGKADIARMEVALTNLHDRGKLGIGFNEMTLIASQADWTSIKKTV